MMMKSALSLTAVFAFAAASLVLSAGEPPRPQGGEPPWMRPSGDRPMHGMKPGMFQNEEKAIEEALQKFRDAGTPENKEALRTAVARLVDARSKARIAFVEKMLEQAKAEAADNTQAVEREMERRLRPRPQGGPGAMFRAALTEEESQKMREINRALRDPQLPAEKKTELIGELKELCRTALNRTQAEIDKAKADGQDTAERERALVPLKNMLSRLDDPEMFLKTMNRRPTFGGGERPGSR